MNRLYDGSQMGKLICGVLVVAIWAAWTDAVYAQLRIVSYNTAGGINSDLQIVLRAIGEEQINGIAKPIDVLLLQEQNSASSNTQTFVNYLNSVYGAGIYARGTVNGGPPTASIRQTIVYNTQTIDLLAENAFGNTVGGPTVAQERQTLRYHLRPDGYGSAADFYAYNSHYRASSSADDQSQRTVEATSIRGDPTFGSDALGEGGHAIFAGDYNMQSSGETAFRTLIAAGPGQANDPINQLGTWNNSSFFAAVHTQSPCSSSVGNCGVGGGMDDRFDFQLTTGEFLDGEGLSYISGSYHAFGNNGSTYNTDINNASNTYVFNGVTSYTKPQILNALRSATDHLPVVVDYQLPAVMDALAEAAPAQLDLGESFDLDVTVSNIADVLAAIGADELDYSLNVSGDIVEGPFVPIVGSDPALGGANIHSIALNTATPGVKSGTVTVSSTSQAVQFGMLQFPISFEVVAPSSDSDYNDDGLVDAGDYVAWRKIPSMFEGDPNGYNQWVENFGSTSVGAGGSGQLNAPNIPEPAACVLLVFGVCMLAARRGRLAAWTRRP